jgi:surface antigen
MERHRAELERARLEQEDYQRRMADYEADIASGRYRRSATDSADAPRRPAADTDEVVASGSRDDQRPRRREVRASTETCEQQLERNRRRGRAIGSLIGGVANLVGGRSEDDKDGRIAFVPAAAMLGEAIAGLLDCDEQERAAAATEEAVSGGVGTTASWTSETRPGVSGSSTVVALEQESGGGECMTVTDVIIVDGEETRAPKRLCRRPPSNRFVRV